MKIAVRVTRSAALVAFALPLAAAAQQTGVSHPDDSPIINTEPIQSQAPVAYAPGAPQLKPRPETPLPAPSTSTPAATFTVVGPAIPTYGAAPVSAATATALADPDAGIVTRIPGPANQLPIGTLIKVRLADQITTASTPNGTQFSARILEPVERDGRVLLPPGAILSGFITDIHGGKRISGAASIHLRTVDVTLPDGTRYPIRAQVVDTSLYKQLKVDEEGTILRRDHAGKTAATFALTTGSGAAAGAMIAGVPGAVVGAAAGAGVSTVVWLKQDRQTELPADTRLVFSLSAPLQVGNE